MKKKLEIKIKLIFGMEILDVLAAPASRAFVERIFSVCGLMTTGRCNRMCNSLEMRAFLKLYKNVC